MLNDFSDKLLLFFDWQRLELGKQFCCRGPCAEILASLGKAVIRELRARRTVGESVPANRDGPFRLFYSSFAGKIKVVREGRKPARRR